MARARNLKPGFFKNELLADCSPLARLLFAGLWCLADREGRLEDRPKRIRAEVLPYDDGSVEDMLDELHKAGFILRYESDGQRFIQVQNFCKHQNPHCKEPPSAIPAPYKHQTSTVQEPDEHRSCPADSLNLIPDSLNLSSDADASVVASRSDDETDGARNETPECPQQELLALYAEHLPMLSQPRIWDGQRANNMRARWRWVLTAKNPKDGKYATDRTSALDFFTRFFAYVAQSDFLTGRDGKWAACDLAWLVKAENFAKVIEGKYENRAEVSE